MRLLFVKQTYDGWPTKVIFEDIEWKTLICNGIKDINNCNIEERKNVLKIFVKFLVMLCKIDEILCKNFRRKRNFCICFS